MVERVMEYESRVRVALYLPCGKPQTDNALNAVVSWLRAKRTRDGERVIQGFTQSNSTTEAFTGYWWDEKAGLFDYDPVTIIWIDYHMNMAIESAELREELGIITDALKRIYQKNRATQKEFWIVAYPVRRYWRGRAKARA